MSDDEDYEIPELPPGRRKDPEQALQEFMNTPLFMKSLPKDVEENEHLAALQSLVFDGPAEEVAQNFKNHGNEAFEGGPAGYKDALEYYSKGIAAKANDDKLNATLYSNRAMVHLQLKNYRSAVNDCAMSLRFDPKNVKAFYRSAVACYYLEKFDEALDSIERGLKLEPNNSAFPKLRTQVLERKKVVEEVEKKRQARLRAEEEERRKLTEAIQERGLKMVSSKEKPKPKKPAPKLKEDAPKRGAEIDFSRFEHIDTDDEDEVVEAYPIPKASEEHKVTLNKEDGRLYWPVFFLYPEHKESDLIAQFHEDSTFRDHLETMFDDPENRPGWDPEGANYTSEKLDVYFETREDLDPQENGKQKERRRLLKIGKDLTLGQVMSSKDFRVVDGMGVFFVLPTKGDFTKTFKKRYSAPKPKPK
ncbi:hypothetical protein BJ742DRAFT_760381 [Cladochytrium replicatum]|nr:hypothetical protein BJ742DRAFT_760381 [Cladochytrium replicatum]